MSDPKLISPLLDGFIMGNPMSSHDGVRCCPALKENSENKYIVKIISVPPSQVQLEALLLTGAYKDPADAMDYFTAVAEGIVQEAGILTRLSKLEGFLPYDGWQIVPMEEGRLGYEVYLVSSYKRSLEKFIRRNTMTHLDAVNLGLDLCQALAICRRAGYLYVDLKPGNVFISRDREYRIGDLGFVPLDALGNSSLAAKYVSPYSAPETTDPMTTLNETVDTYAVGMILYQIYNGGVLPQASDEAFPSPRNADYEMAEIILKALSPNPQERWQDPMTMGQALVAYMQRNSVSKTPITPQGPLNTEGVSLKDAQTFPEEMEEAPFQEEDVPEVQEEPDTTAPETEEHLPVDAQDSLPGDAESEASQSIPQETDVLSQEAEILPEEVPAQMPELVLSPEDPVEPEQEEPEALTQFFQETFTLPEPEPLVLPQDLFQDTFPNMLEPDQEDEALFALDKMSPAPSVEPEVSPAAPMVPPQRKERRKIGTAWIAPVAMVLVLALLGFGGFWFYQNYYLQTIDNLTIDGSMSTLTVTVDTQADPGLLSVICTDTYGNAYTKPLTGGKAVFENLLPNSQYKVQLEVSGFHQLVGKTTDMFNTEALTNVVSFTAGIGPEDGSAVLSMTVEGGEPEEWVLTYSAQEEEPKTMTFSGHSVTVKDLTVGKTYTFQLGTQENIPLNGITELTYEAAKIILAENLHVTAIHEGSMTVRWNADEDVFVESWFVRCYDNEGEEQIQEVTSNAATFGNIESDKSYTIEVTASGMTQPSRTTVTANPITITGFQVDDDHTDSFTVSWDFEGQAPDGGWLLMYGFNGSDKQSVLKCQEPTAVITPKVPTAGYVFTIQAADSTTVLGSRQTYATAQPEVFFDFALSAEYVTGHLLKTPQGEWSYESAGKQSFSDSFRAGDKLSLVLHAGTTFYLREEEVSVLYVFRDENDAVIQELVARDTLIWRDIWQGGDYRYGELDIPTAPDTPGKYSLSLYFNNAAVIYITFTVQ